MRITIIAAISANNVIGVNNQLPWRLKADMQFFRKTTWGHCVIMGRKTFESMNSKPLPGRLNIVLSRKPSCSGGGPENLMWLSSLEAALAVLSDQQPAINEVFIIGGASLYAESLPHAARLMLTHVETNVETNPGDDVARFPDVNPHDWRTTIVHTIHPADADNEHPFILCEYEPRASEV